MSLIAVILVVLGIIIVISAAGILGYYLGHRTRESKCKLQVTMRKLWDEHVALTRLYLVEAIAGLPGVNATAERLLKNQEDIGNAIKPYYGTEAGNSLTALLKDHILGAVEVVAAAKSKDSSRLDTAKKNWYANADDIAVFLSRAKIASETKLKQEMKMHLDLTLAEASAQLNGNYADSIKFYDQAREHILAFADVLSSGL